MVRQEETAARLSLTHDIDHAHRGHMFWTIVLAILAAAVILFVVVGILAYVVVQWEWQAEIDHRQAVNKGVEKLKQEHRRQMMELGLREDDRAR
jgi:hypothetical protein